MLSPIPVGVVLLSFSFWQFFVGAQLVQATSLTNGGNYYYPSGAGQTSHTVHSTPAASQPTLVYNCDQMPAICQNVANWVAAHPGTTFPIEQTYDLQKGPSRSQDNSYKRRGAQCPGSWANNHACPESNQPATNSANFANNGPTGIYQAQGNDPTDLSLAQLLRNFIVTRNNILVGLRYSCDEFPPATWISGGNGPNGNNGGTTYCVAHRSAACTDFGNAAFNLLNTPNDRSEQDWQGESHTKLRSVIESLYNVQINAGGLENAGTFQFTTLAAAAARAQGIATNSRAWVIQPGVVTSVVNKRAEATGQPSTTIVRGPATTHVITGKEQKPKPWKEPWKVLYSSSSHEHLLKQQIMTDNASYVETMEDLVMSISGTVNNCKAKTISGSSTKMERIVGLDLASDHILLF